jgi:CheY-like chemotaxis protein
VNREGEGLLLEPALAIHTAFMRFPIDVVFLDAYMRVIKVVESLPPWRSAAARSARSVLELAAGQAGRRGVALGDRLDVREVTEAGLARALSSHLAQVAHTQGAPRVLLISDDRRFRAVAAALFTRRGWPVTEARSGDDLGELVASDRPDVALVDASNSLTVAAEAVTQLKREHRTIAVVAVSDAVRPQLAALPTHSKWGSFDSLCLAIEQAHRQCTGQDAAPGAHRHRHAGYA